MVKILGLSASPRRAATCTAVQRGLEVAGQKPGVTTEFISLAGKTILPCIDCGACIRNSSWCVLKDDMQALTEQFIQADAYLIGSPVYVHTAAPQLSAFFGRLRPLQKKHPGIFRLRPGAALAVGGSRNGGEEAAVLTILQMMMTKGMILVSGESRGYIGGKVWSQDNKNFAPEDDALGMAGVEALAAKLADVALLLKGQP